MSFTNGLRVALLLSCLCNRPASAQESPTTAALPKQIQASLALPLVEKSAADWEIREHLMGRVHPTPHYPGATAWNRDKEQLRQRVLRDYVLTGWPKAWVDAPVRATETGVLHPEPGIDIRKLTLEVGPHFYVTALLYVPLRAHGKIPAILDTIGHEKETGIAVLYQQTLCMDQARMGMYALSLEWTGIGDLSAPGNAHAYLAHLDLTGRRGLGLFYLADRKALDYLLSLPGVDPSRVGMTGLSGGGFQTVLLSALDPRIAVSVEVAGFSPGASKVERGGDQGDMEQVPGDFLSGVDYPALIAMRAPKPTMLIHNAMDNCCYRAELVKPLAYDALLPFWQGDRTRFGWHTNYVPGTHNYERDNRNTSLSFFAHHFGLPSPPDALEDGLTLYTKREIDSKLPADALTVLALANTFAEENAKTGPTSVGATPTVQRKELAYLVRFTPVGMQHAWPLAIATDGGVEATRYRFQFTNGLSAYGVFVRKLNGTAQHVRLVCDDAGVAATSAAVQSALEAGDGVLTAELTLTTPALGGSVMNHSELFNSLGERAAGIEAAELLALTSWLREARNATAVAVTTRGTRSGFVALTASALQPRSFASLQQTDSLDSFTTVFAKPVTFRDAPELFPLGLQESFDLPALQRLGAGAPDKMRNVQSRTRRL